jgi:hypothetical protein
MKVVHHHHLITTNGKNSSRVDLEELSRIHRLVILLRQVRVKLGWLDHHA